MLLVDDHYRRIASFRPAEIQVPVVPHAPWRAVEAARNWLYRFSLTDYFVVQALQKEIGSVCGHPMLGGSSIAILVDTVASGLVSRRIQVASHVPTPVRLTFDEHVPFEGPFDAVIFPDLMKARKIVATFRANSSMAGEVARAWNYGIVHAGLRLASTRTVHASRDNVETLSGPTTRSMDGSVIWNPEDVAALLMRGSLMLVQRSLARTHLHLAWRRPYVVGAATNKLEDALVGSSQPRQARWEAGATRDKPRSVILDGLTSMSQQATALLAAAQSGTPFCEECAKPVAPT